jgi:uncharacterized protein (TIGR03435 family)
MQFLLTAFCLLVQTQPQFEVASIKPSPRPITPRTPMKTDPARVVYNNMTARILIQIAYKMDDWMISGIPKGLDSELYDVAATLPAGASQEQVPAMLQSLLAERFQLAVRLETRQFPVYALTVAKNGPKLKPGETEEQWHEGAMKGGIFRGEMQLHQCSMPSLASALSRVADRPVIDRTSLTGNYDVVLKWTPDQTQPGDQKNDNPPIYTAVTEQLGLKLEPTKAPIEILIVTRMEKPSAN